MVHEVCMYVNTLRQNFRIQRFAYPLQWQIEITKEGSAGTLVPANLPPACPHADAVIASFPGFSYMLLFVPRPKALEREVTQAVLFARPIRVHFQCCNAELALPTAATKVLGTKVRTCSWLTYDSYACGLSGDEYMVNPVHRVNPVHLYGLKNTGPCFSCFVFSFALV